MMQKWKMLFCHSFFLRRLDCVLDNKRDEIMNEIKDLLMMDQKRFKLKGIDET